MRFRRRRGLGSRGGSSSSRGSGDGSSGGRKGRTGESSRGLLSGGRRRWGAAVLTVLLGLGVGYLVAAEIVFPGGEEAAASEIVEVPDLVGLTAEEARASLSSAGLALGVRSEMPHPDAVADAVIAQSPLPGQYARPGAPVEVTLSAGPETGRVPDLRGLSDRQGSIVLERLGFGVVRDTVDSRVERGRVVGTRPEAGSELELPAEITVLVSAGPAVVDVPELVGRHIDDVEPLLQRSGFRLGRVSYDSEARAAPGRVVAQSPSPGFALREGGEVSVEVAGPPPGGGGGASDALPGARGDTIDGPVESAAADRVDAALRPGRRSTAVPVGGAVASR